MWWVKPRFSVLLSEGRNQSWSVYLGELFSSAGVFFAKLWNYHQRRNLYFNEFDEADSMTDRSVVVAFTPNSAYNLVDMFDLIKRCKFSIMPIFSVQDGKIMSIKTRCLGTKKTERWLFLPIHPSPCSMSERSTVTQQGVFFFSCTAVRSTHLRVWICLMEPCDRRVCVKKL